MAKNNSDEMRTALISDAIFGENAPSNATANAEEIRQGIDAFMESDEAIARLAESIYMTGPGGKVTHWEDLTRARQRFFIKRASLVAKSIFLNW